MTKETMMTTTKGNWYTDLNKMREIVETTDRLIDVAKVFSGPVEFLSWFELLVEDCVKANNKYHKAFDRLADDAAKIAESRFKYYVYWQFASFCLGKLADVPAYDEAGKSILEREVANLPDYVNKS